MKVTPCMLSAGTGGLGLQTRPGRSKIFCPLGQVLIAIDAHGAGRSGNAASVVVVGGGGVVIVVLVLDVGSVVAAAALVFELQLVAKSRLRMTPAPRARRSKAFTINYPPPG